MALLLTAIASVAAQHAAAQEYYREELHIPLAAAGGSGLEALLVRPAAPQRYPLALITHGTSGDPQVRRAMNPYEFYGAAVEFARRGFAALVVMRRGFGASGGEYPDGVGCCELRAFLRVAKSSSEDLRAAIAAMRDRTDVTAQGAIAVGASTGGFAALALAASSPPGLAAAINFAGGLHKASLTGTDRRDSNAEAELVKAFSVLGTTSRIPTLWIYAENDSFFRPDLAQELFDAFTAVGGVAQLINAPALGRDGHFLFSAAGAPVWTSMVDAFLREHNLGASELLAGATLPALPPPQLNTKGRAAFDAYLAEAPHKAFAVSPRGDYGYWARRRSLQDAQSRALEGCAKHAADCAIYANDDQLAEPASATSR